MLMKIKFFYNPPVSVIWRLTNSKAGIFAIAYDSIKILVLCKVCQHAKSLNFIII